jgi:hypothetical protein
MTPLSVSLECSISLAAPPVPAVVRTWPSNCVCEATAC